MSVQQSERVALTLLLEQVDRDLLRGCVRTLQYQRTARDTEGPEKLIDLLANVMYP